MFVQQSSEPGQILARLVVGQEENQKRMEQQDKCMERQERCLKASIDKQAECVVLLKVQMIQQSSAFCEAINQQGQKIDLMCNVFTGCFNQLYSGIGVKAPDFQMLQL